MPPTVRSSLKLVIGRLIALLLTASCWPTSGSIDEPTHGGSTDAGQTQVDSGANVRAADAARDADATDDLGRPAPLDAAAERMDGGDAGEVGSREAGEGDSSLTCDAKDPIGPPSSYVPGSYETSCGSRDPFTWPYSKNSPWNMPIGSDARYVPAGIREAIQTFGDYRDGPIFFDTDPNFNLRAVASDPLVTIYNGNYHTCETTRLAQPFYDGPTPWQVRVPTSFITQPFDRYHANDSNLSSAIVQPDDSIVQFNYTGRCSAGGALIGTALWQFIVAHRTRDEIDLDQHIRSGMGIYGGHGGSALSAHGGNLRKGELTSDEPIRHALSVELWGYYLYYEDACANPQDGVCHGYRWPAATQDGAAFQGRSNPDGGYYGQVPDFRMGSLLAIVPSESMTSLGLTTKVGAKLFRALQDYGAYVVDDTGWRRMDFNLDVEAIADVTAAWGHGFSFAPDDATQSNRDVYRDLVTLVTHLQVVANNGATSTGGGGRPRVPLAPDFAP